MGTYLRALSKNYPMNTNMTGFRWFSKIFASLCLDESSLSIGRVRIATRCIKSLLHGGLLNQLALSFLLIAP